MSNRIKCLLVIGAIIVAFSWWQDDQPAGISNAKASAVDLLDEIEAGNVRIEVSGTGGSTGTVVTGHLVNTTNTAKKVNVNLNRPLYLQNGNEKAQNMIATEVYRLQRGSDRLEYLSLANGDSYIDLGANGRTPIAFTAYCADFEKDNPGVSDSFTVGDIPPSLISIANAARNHSDNQSDITVAVQLAFWLKQGVSIDEIRERFKFTPDDYRLAKKLTQ